MTILWLILALLVLLALPALGWTWLTRRCHRANLTDWGAAWLNWLDGLNRLLCVHYHRLALTELPLPAAGPAILVANHVSGLDPLLLIACSRRPLRFLIAREQYRRLGVQWLFKAVGCIPVDRERSPEKAMRQAFKALRNGEVVALFPHGKIHLESDPPRRPKAGAARLAAISQAPVIPVRISGPARQGHVVSSVLIRGKARVERLPVIDSAALNSDQLYAAIESAINGESWE